MKRSEIRDHHPYIVMLILIEAAVIAIEAQSDCHSGWRAAPVRNPDRTRLDSGFARKSARAPE
jgi:hypothetical protein